jgi:polyphosphate glucokinase
MDVLVIDVGGSHVKMLAGTADAPRHFDSHADLGPDEMVRQVRAHTRGWRYDVITIGYPGAVGNQGPRFEPGNLGQGWVGFDFAAAFGVPVRVVNDAVMQAIGAYDGGRMLFLGLGTGLGSALVTDRVAVAFDLGNLPTRHDESLGERIGQEGLERHGQPEWEREVAYHVDLLRHAFVADYVVLGGGNASLVTELPPDTRRGGNDDAFAGGFRVWEEVVEPHDRPSPSAWRVLP